MVQQLGSFIDSSPMHELSCFFLLFLYVLSSPPPTAIRRLLKKIQLIVIYAIFVACLGASFCKSNVYHLVNWFLITQVVSDFHR